MVGCLGIEALVALRKVGREPDVIFGAKEFAVEAAYHGISSLIVSVDEQIPGLLTRLEIRRPEIRAYRPCVRMTFQVLAQADRSRILLLPQSGSKTLFEGHLRLKDMPQGPRVFKFLVKKESEAEKYLPPEDALRMLRKASAIYLARGDPNLEKKFIELLEAYQLGYKFVSVCNHCLGQRKVTYVGQEAIAYKGAWICENCAAAELLREADFRHLGRAAKAHLARILKNRRNLDDVVGLLSLQRLEPELTRFDIIPASQEEPTLPLESIQLPKELMELLASQIDQATARAIKIGKGRPPGRP